MSCTQTAPKTRTETEVETRSRSRPRHRNGAERPTGPANAETAETTAGPERPPTRKPRRGPSRPQPPPRRRQGFRAIRRSPIAPGDAGHDRGGSSGCPTVRWTTRRGNGESEPGPVTASHRSGPARGHGPARLRGVSRSVTPVWSGSPCVGLFRDTHASRDFARTAPKKAGKLGAARQE